MTNEAVKKKNSFKPKSVLSKPVITTRMLVSIALCSAIAYVLMLIEIAIPIVPSFVKFDFSDLPALICDFTFGPLAVSGRRREGLEIAGFCASRKDCYS